MSSTVKMEFPLSSEFMTSIRLATGGLCSAAGLNMDDAEDCKVCVTESLLLLMHRGFSRALAQFEPAEGIGITVEGLEKTGEESSPVEDEISEALLTALVENIVMEKKEGTLYRISFRFGVQA